MGFHKLSVKLNGMDGLFPIQSESARHLDESEVPVAVRHWKDFVNVTLVKSLSECRVPGHSKFPSNIAS